MKAEKGWPSLAGIAVFAFPALSVGVPDGYSIAGVFLLLVSVLAVRQWWGRPVEPRQAWLLIGAFLFMAAIWQIDGLRSDGGWRSTDKPLKFLLVIPCLLFLLRVPARKDFLWAGICCGGIVAGVAALYESFWLRLPRAEGSINAIQFGNLGLLLGLMSAMALLMWRPARWPRAAMALAAAGAALGAWSSLLSQSRGGWLAMFLMAPLLVILLRRAMSWRQIFVSAVVALLGSAALVVLTARLMAGPPAQEGQPVQGQPAAQDLQARIEQARSEMERYEATGDAVSSVGQRLDHWKAAWRMALNHPLLGWSQKGYEIEKQRLVDAGQASPYILEFNHAHNEFLDLFAKRGLIGVAALLFLYGVPLVLFWPRRGQPGADRPLLPLQIIGVLIPLTYAGCGLTQGFLGHNSGTMFFVFMTSLIFTTLQGERALLAGKASEQAAAGTRAALQHA